MDEFDIIRRYFDRPVACPGVVVPVGDDGAVLEPGAATQVQVMDTLLADVHFPAALPACDIGWRAVAVNLSDLAAMGARPYSMLLALTLPSADADWLADFADGLFAIGDEYSVALVGGDTTRGANLSITIAMTGLMGAGEAPLLRSGARAGDGIFVSGSPGDAAAALALYAAGDHDAALMSRFARPTPRVDLGRRLLGKASAAIDISDGLLADLGRLLSASGVGGVVDAERLPISAALSARFDPAECQRFALQGGDDYELCFTAAPDVDVPGCTRIGTVVAGDGLECRRDGELVSVDASGYRHFHD